MYIRTKIERQRKDKMVGKCILKIEGQIGRDSWINQQGTVIQAGTKNQTVEI